MTHRIRESALALVLGLALTPCGARYSIDAWRAQRRAPDKERPTHVTWGNVRFFQALLISLYFTSGIVKARGDWLDNGYVLWTHLHDSYQTSVSHFLANLLPARFWTAAQVATLVFEIGAPLLFGLRRTRSAALLYGLALHVMIGLCFGPVVYFALLMMALLLSGFAPLSWLSLLLRPFERPAAKEKAKAAADDKPAEAS